MSDTKIEEGSSLDALSKLHAETAKINWHELQRFFAQGKVIWVSRSRELPRVAAAMVEDDAQHIAELKECGDIAPVRDAQARGWYKDNAVLWAVVVSPFVLVQEFE